MLYWLGYGLDDPEFYSQQGQEIFLFSKTSRLALRHISCSVQRISLVPIPGSSGRGLIAYPCLVSRLRKTGTVCLLLYTLIVRRGKPLLLPLPLGIFPGLSGECICCSVKVKGCPYNAVQEWRVIGGTALPILNLGAKWVSVITAIPLPLCLWERTQLSIAQEAGWH